MTKITKAERCLLACLARENECVVLELAWFGRRCRARALLGNRTLATGSRYDFEVIMASGLAKKAFCCEYAEITKAGRAALKEDA